MEGVEGVEVSEHADEYRIDALLDEILDALAVRFVNPIAGIEALRSHAERKSAHGSEVMATTQLAPTVEDRSEGRVLLTLNLAPEIDLILEQLAARTGGNKVDVLRKAIGLLKLASDAKAEGKRVGIVEGDQALDVEFIGI